MRTRAIGRRLCSVLGCSVLGYSVLLGCGSGDPVNPCPTPATTLGGTYTGQASDNTGPGTLTLVLTQSGSTITGSMTLVAVGIAGSITGHGTVSGKVCGPKLTFTASIPVGGFPSPYASCAATMNGTADNVTSSIIHGSYAGNNSCTGSVSGGTFNLVRQ